LEGPSPLAEQHTLQRPYHILHGEGNVNLEIYAAEVALMVVISAATRVLFQPLRKPAK
jgi:hypothetical protein